ncbi:MAG: EamA family transporter [Planctomycetes bacterium]|nr:EamA family transporter [Planctomycetota bacterium]
MRIADVIRLVLLAALWGSSFMFQRVVAPAIGPLATAASRLLIAGVALTLAFVVMRSDIQWRHWRQYLLIGIVNSAVPFFLFAFAALYIPASYSAVMNSTAPMFAALIGTLFLREPFTWKAGLGLALGAVGVALVARAGPVELTTDALLALGACLAASCSYAISGAYMKRKATLLKPRNVAAASQLFAGLGLCLLLLPFALGLVGPQGPLRAPTLDAVTTQVALCALALALLCGAVAYLIYYRLVADVGATRALTVTFLIPVFGVLWGALILHETITGPMLGGCALVIAATWLVVNSQRK